MKKGMENQEQINLPFNDKTFKIDTEKLSEILKKLDILQNPVKKIHEVEKLLKKNHLYEEEFIEFISF